MKIFCLKSFNFFLLLFVLILFLVFFNFLLIAIEGWEVFCDFSVNSFFLYSVNIFLPFLFFLLYFRKPYRVTVKEKYIIFESIFGQQKKFDIQNLLFIYRDVYLAFGIGADAKYIVFIFKVGDGEVKIEMVDMIKDVEKLFEEIKRIKPVIKVVNKKRFRFFRKIFIFQN